jgi:hypothetical protein
MSNQADNFGKRLKDNIRNAHEILVKYQPSGSFISTGHFKSLV